MIEEVTNKTATLQKNSLQRKNEEEKLMKERNEIEKKQREIAHLQKILEQKK